MKQTVCKLSEFKLLLLGGFSKICVMITPITVLLSCGRRVHNYSAFFGFVFRANLWPVESGSVFLFFFVFFQFCDVVQSAHHYPIRNYTLARFEDIQNMKVENLKPSHIVAIVVIFLGSF